MTLIGLLRKVRYLRNGFTSSTPPVGFHGQLGFKLYSNQTSSPSLHPLVHTGNPKAITVRVNSAYHKIIQTVVHFIQKEQLVPYEEHCRNGRSMVEHKHPRNKAQKATAMHCCRQQILSLLQEPVKAAELVRSNIFLEEP